MKKYLLTFVLLTTISFQSECQYVIQSYLITTISKNDLNYIPGLNPEYDVDAYYILYNTVDAHGNAAVASGACFIPVVDSCNFFPLISYQHGTILRKSDVPSRLFNESIIGQIFASLGNITVCPDYLGLGDSPGLHPYCHSQTEATATVDFIRAAREMMNDSLGVFDNGQVFLTGYSQGGHATMATHKYIEDNNLTAEINVVASAPGSGPYHMSGAQAEMIFNTPDYPSPSYLVYLLFAYNSVYNNIFDGTDEVLKSPYDVTIPPYLNGNFSTWQLNNALPDSLHLFLQDTFLQSVIDDMDDKLTPVWQNLLDNDNYDWLPQAPIRMYYCTADEQVSYLNSVNAEAAMIANGAVNVQAIDVNSGANHGDCGLPAIVSGYYWFNTMRIPCVNTSITEGNILHDIQLFPNPASEFIVISGLPMECHISCYDMQGREVFKIKFAKQEELLVDVSSLFSGLYILRIQTSNMQNQVKKFSIIR